LQYSFFIHLRKKIPHVLVFSSFKF
jgi:hypothetical protein